jgi:protein-L-isoaspartate(D-aspartate) O-methyltransferase
MPPPAGPADRTNHDMVDRLIAEGALWSPALIAAFRATPRHRFLDRVFQYQRKHHRWREVLTRDPGAEELAIVYSDRALITHLSPAGADDPGVPISSSSQPSLMAQMLEDLQLEAGLRTLEVGAGTGYNAALLAHVVGPGLVTAVDVDREVLSEAWDHLRAFPERRVELRHADGRHGYPEAAPYDRIMVTAATTDLEPAWLEQLAEGGLVLAPLALAPGLAYVLRGTVSAGVFHGRLTRAAYFMPLRAEQEAGVAEADAGSFAGPLQTLPAPWAGWFDRRRPRLKWLGFIQALVFYGLLRGHSVHYRTLANGQPVFGVSGPASDGKPGGRVCWLGAQDWQVSGAAGRDLGWGLWRAFLDAGGPWPTEFRLTASPHGGLSVGPRESYLRQGPRCQQVWEVSEPRDRPAWM